MRARESFTGFPSCTCLLLLQVSFYQDYSMTPEEMRASEIREFIYWVLLVICSVILVRMLQPSRRPGRGTGLINLVKDPYTCDAWDRNDSPSVRRDRAEAEALAQQRDETEGRPGGTSDRK